MNEERLTRRSIIAIMAAGLLTGVVALLATMFVVGNVQPTYRAEGLVAMVPSKQVPAGEQTSLLEALSGGQASRVAAEVFKQSKFVDAAAQAAGVSASSLQVTAAPVDATQLIAVTVTGPSAAAAEAAAKAIILAGTPAVQTVSGGQYDLPIIQDPAGTAVSASVSASQLLIVAFIGGLLVGAGAALIIVRARSRGDDEPEYLDSGEFRAVQGSGYGRPVGPPPGRPVPGPAANGGPYGPPRRPAGDPRAQQQPPR